MKNKTIDYILGFITGIAIAIAAVACSNPLQAGASEIGSNQYNPIYVKIVQ